MTRSLARFALPFVLALAAACADSATAPRSLPPHRPSFFVYPTLAAPSNLTADVTSSGVLLTWTDNSPDETAFNARFTDPATGAIVKTWHADSNATSVVVQIGGLIGLPDGTYDVTLYAVGYYYSTDPAIPSTNTWSDPSNVVRIEVGGATVLTTACKPHGKCK